MLPNAEMVPKECGFNQSETAMHGHSVTFTVFYEHSPAMARDDEFIKSSILVIT